MRYRLNYLHLVQGVSAFGLAAALFQTHQHWQRYHSLEVVSPALIHLPMAVFGMYVAWLSAPRHPLFASIAAVFVCLNAVLV